MALPSRKKRRVVIREKLQPWGAAAERREGPLGALLRPRWPQRPAKSARSADVRGKKVDERRVGCVRGVRLRWRRMRRIVEARPASVGVLPNHLRWKGDGLVRWDRTHVLRIATPRIVRVALLRPDSDRTLALIRRHFRALKTVVAPAREEHASPALRRAPGKLDPEEHFGLQCR